MTHSLHISDEVTTAGTRLDHFDDKDARAHAPSDDRFRDGQVRSESGTAKGSAKVFLQNAPSMAHFGTFDIPRPQDIVLDGDVRKRSNDGSWKDVYLVLTAEV